ncbi:hypothetical protein [Paraburkholderia graminis]|uniref:Uncharacterized protein n=1 Tax=Paraburkholderia graminis TaxID=60548 RepID=A0ABD5CSE1_9BURK|nr:hypothetical protein [Paraburkholderia graminis]
MSAIIDAVSDSFSEFAGCSLGVNRDERMGDLLRVTIIVSESLQQRMAIAQLTTGSTPASSSVRNTEAMIGTLIGK